MLGAAAPAGARRLGARAGRDRDRGRLRRRVPLRPRARRLACRASRRTASRSIGTVSKSLAPGLRLGWIVCPPSLAATIAHEKDLDDRGSPALDQLALAALLESGRYDRHLRTMRASYARRRAALVEALAAHAPARRAARAGRGLPRGRPAARRRRRGRGRGRGARAIRRPARHAPVPHDRHGAAGAGAGLRQPDASRPSSAASPGSATCCRADAGHCSVPPSDNWPASRRPTPRSPAGRPARPARAGCRPRSRRRRACCRIERTCVSTVFSVSHRRRAMLAFVRPSAISAEHLALAGRQLAPAGRRASPA